MSVTTVPGAALGVAEVEVARVRVVLVDARFEQAQAEQVAVERRGALGAGGDQRDVVDAADREAARLLARWSLAGALERDRRRRRRRGRTRSGRPRVRSPALTDHDALEGDRAEVLAPARGADLRVLAVEPAE